MPSDTVAIATMTRAADGEHADTLVRALTVLSRSEFRIFVADAGSGDTFRTRLAALPNVHLRLAQPTLAQQVKAAVSAALASGVEWILYTEPDKQPFFEHGMRELISAATQCTEDVIVASRDDESMRTFPEGQRSIESHFNCIADSFLRTGRHDLLYGPIAFRARVLRAHLTDDAPNDLGWGWRPWVLARTFRGGGRIGFLPGRFVCPESQRTEDTDRDRLYRLRQLSENLRGLHAGLAG